MALKLIDKLAQSVHSACGEHVNYSACVCVYTILRFHIQKASMHKHTLNVERTNPYIFIRGSADYFIKSCLYCGLDRERGVK